MGQPVIEIIGLSKHFGELEALRPLHCEIMQGEIFSIVGPDGAGKTTLIRMLCGLLSPSSGTAKINGFDIRTGMNRIKPLIGYLSQKFSLYGDLSVDENLDFFAEIHGIRDYRREKENLLEFTRLKPARKRLAEKLSGGMKQKLALACTLIHTPSILFLDEPTTGVDPVSRRDFWIILSGLIKKGLTIVMTTPYMDEAERCSRVGLLNRGSLLTVDTPEGIRAMMKDEILEIVCDRTRDAFRYLDGRDILKDIVLFGDRLNLVLTDRESIDHIINLLQRNDITVKSYRTIKPRLENVFISLIKKEKGEGYR
ncbi:MAG: ABC transporter ATP-binding protein [Spirochaetales bacterium]|nr:ABC transporter ATP-binding protein [Spirochaetales bacterium]